MSGTAAGCQHITAAPGTSHQRVHDRAFSIRGWAQGVLRRSGSAGRRIRASEGASMMARIDGGRRGEGKRSRTESQTRSTGLSSGL